MIAVPDHIVVGGGTAGCVLAARLSEDPSRSVLLLEAGPESPPAAARLPAAWALLQSDPVGRGLVTSAQPGLGGRRVAYPLGRVLGGSSVINAMIHLPGRREDFDAWAAGGASGWGYQELIPFFGRSAVRAAVPEQRGAFDQAFDMVLASDQRLSDVGFHPAAIARGRRQNVADAYLTDDVRARPNLAVRTGVEVRRLLLEGDRCVGVEVVDGPGLRPIRAGAGVVLAAGAVGSPHLLLRSGIGPADDLRQAGIEVQLDQPAVGDNLQDHALLPLGYAAGDRTPTTTAQYAQVSALMRTEPGVAEPDLQFLVVSVPWPASGAGAPAAGFTLAVALVRPASRGSVRLNPRPDGPPVVDPGYLTDPRDVERLVLGLRTGRELVADPRLAPWRGPELAPGAAITSAAELAQYARRATGPYWHPMGSCRMGTGHDAVVDVRLRVRGVDGLHVADASVFPGAISVNPHATVLAVAERAADLIRS